MTLATRSMQPHAVSPGQARSWSLPAVGWLLLAVGVWLAFLSWMRPLALPDEGRYAGVAWDMLRNGSFAVPLIDGMPYFHKPPLYYWLAELSFRLFGVNEWAARLPSALAAWASAVALYLFVRRHRDAASATLCVLVLATLPLFFGGAQYANMDMLVAGMITLCVLAGADTALRVRGGQAWRAMALATGVCAALAMLAKGLIGLVLPGAILLAWLAWRRDWRGLRALPWPPAILAFAVVAVPWFWLMQVRYPGFFQYFFVHQHFERFAQTGFNNVQPFWFYLPVIAGLALPWSLWAGGLLRKQFWAADADPDGLRRLALVWLAVIVAFFSMPQSKLVGYIMPVLPPLAFLLAEVVMGALRDPAVARATRRMARVSALVAVAICVTAVFVASFNARGSSRELALSLRGELRPDDTLVALHTYPFDLQLYAHAARPMWVVDDWSNPEIPKRDNWRRELYDAVQFEPALGERLLVSADTFQQRLCQAPEGSRYWVWGTAADEEAYAPLRGQAARFADARRSLWLVLVDEAFKGRVCDGTPTGG
ncbi:ArnT family glycosyltransferase [Bordetella parapertussis]|uniref:Membrane protein n=1 Tax=Bordetella parapertussis (strain Bpp5) TaxID=1208660 RepID=K0MI60_BORPB|nr:glycosyltransferase family 39 protein [Bordetella parapertussis]CCJ51209.1 putative membrane protein [Bordetella parapertussis Bpp5]